MSAITIELRHPDGSTVRASITSSDLTTRVDGVALELPGIDYITPARLKAILLDGIRITNRRPEPTSLYDSLTGPDKSSLAP